VGLGDFNLHHPLWLATHQHAGSRLNAESLLIIIEEFRLRLITEHRTPTHCWKAGESTINLAFTLEDLANHVIHCKIDRKLDCDSNHLLISLVFDWSWQPANLIRKHL
jgi:hypothetical protein